MVKYAKIILNTHDGSGPPLFNERNSVIQQNDSVIPLVHNRVHQKPGCTAPLDILRFYVRVEAVLYNLAKNEKLNR